MLQTLPLHLALLLVPYLSPLEIARARLVCKGWLAAFTSDKLLLTALRTHFPLSHEVRTHPYSSPPDSTFTRVARRYAALTDGAPQQELRVPITKTRRDFYVWTFSENLLVYQSGHFPHAVLSLLYLDYAARRVRHGRITLDAQGQTVIRVKVNRDVLVVERTDEHVIHQGRTNFLASAECYRLQLTGDGDGGSVSAKRISVIETFEFPYIDYSYQILSDHSATYYAAYSKSSGLDSGVGVWEIETGRKVKRIAPAMLEDIGGMMTDLIVVREESGHKVVMVGNDKRNNNARRWDRFPSEWGYLSNIRIFPIDGADDECAKGFVGRAKPDCPHNSNLLTTTFKVPRLPGGLNDTADEAESAALVLWELEDHTDKATAHYHTLSTAALNARTAEEPLPADTQYVLPSTHSAFSETGQRPAPFTVKTKDALSFTMDFTGRNEDFEGTRLMLYHLKIQGFYPSPTDPGVMDLAWESSLKEADTARVQRRDKKSRGIYSSNRNVTYQNYYGMEVVGDERAVVFLELKEGGMDLVVVVWDEPFENTECIKSPPTEVLATGLD